MVKKSDIEPIVVSDEKGRPVIANLRLIILDFVLKNGRVTFDEIFDYVYGIYLKTGRKLDKKRFRNFMRVTCHRLQRQEYLARIKRGVYRISDSYMRYLEKYDYDIKKTPQYILRQQFYQILKKFQTESGIVVKVLRGGGVD